MVKIIYYKTIDYSAKRFKCVETDISYEPYMKIIKKIVEAPKIVAKASEYFTNLLDPKIYL